MSESERKERIRKEAWRLLEGKLKSADAIKFPITALTDVIRLTEERKPIPVEFSDEQAEAIRKRLEHQWKKHDDTRDRKAG